jgi:hypothetical protein
MAHVIQRRYIFCTATLFFTTISSTTASPKHHFLFFLPWHFREGFHVKAKSLCSLFEATKSLAPQPQVNEWLAKVTGNLFQFQDQEQKRTEELPSP